MLTSVWMFNYSFAKNKDMQFEIIDCSVQRTATTEKSGPCPGSGMETKLDGSLGNTQTAMAKNSEPTPIHSNLAGSLEPVDPFGPILK